MKPPRFLLSLLGIGLVLPPAISVAADSKPLVPPLHVETAKLGLPRLQAPRPGADAAPLAPERFQVDAPAARTIEAEAGITQRAVAGVDLLEIQTDRALSEPLLHAEADVIYVSFGLYGTAGTIVSVGGAWLAIAESPAANSAQLMVGVSDGKEIKWEPAGMHTQWSPLENKLTASFSTLTIRLDRARQVWDFYSGVRLKGEQLPLRPRNRREATTFSAQGGVDGAWISGVVQSLDNPLFEDVNNNGIADTFEVEATGALLTASVDQDTIRELTEAWKRSKQQIYAPPMMIFDPRLDREAASSIRRRLDDQGGEQ